jgi:hypothetical protein
MEPDTRDFGRTIYRTAKEPRHGLTDLNMKVTTRKEKSMGREPILGYIKFISIE